MFLSPAYESLQLLTYVHYIYTTFCLCDPRKQLHLRQTI